RTRAADRVASTTATGVLLGAVVPAARQPACTTAKGVSRGEWMRPKTQHECTSVAARLPVVQHFREKTLGSTTARVRSTVAALRLEIRRGFTTVTELILGGRRPRAAQRRITIRLGDMSGGKRGRLVCPSPSLSTNLDSKMTRLYSTIDSIIDNSP